MEEDDEDFEELFSFAAASPGQPTQEKMSPSSAATSADFDIITNDNDSSGSGGDNARTTSCSAMMPSTPAAASAATSQSDFDDLFGSPPTNRPPSSSVSAAAATTKEREEDDPAIASFLGSDALDGFDVHDEGTRDFLDWLDDDTKKNDDQINKNVGSNDKNNDTAVAVDDDDDDFDFDQMLSEVGIEDVKKPAVVVKESTTPMTGSKGSNAQKEVDQVKQIVKTQPVQTKTEPKKEESPAPTEAKPTVSTKETAPLSSPATATIPPVTQKVDEVPPKEEPVTKANDDNISAPPVVAANDDVIESQSTNNNDVEDDAVAAAIESTPKTDNEANIESNENEIKEEITPETATQGRPSVEDELSYQQWNDDNDDDDDAEVTDVNIIPESGNEGDLSSGKDDTVVNGKKIVFTSLSEAIRSSASTIEDVRSLFKKEYGLEQIRPLSSEDRAHLWTKVICGKVLEDVDNGSLADSFREWQNNNTTVASDGECMSMLDPLLLSASSIDSDNEVYEATRDKLFSVLNYHSQGKGSSAKADPLLPPVAHAILQTGMPLAVASVVLSQIEPKAMPLMRLSNAERFLAAKALHADFYLLACYHLPLLMMHLDRNCQGWHWPKANKEGIAEEAIEERTGESDNQESIGDEAETDEAETVEENAKTKKEKEYGLIPLNWFVTNFAGECGEACMDHADLLPLWDHLLTTGESSWKFFLAIAVLEKRSDVLLMMKGDELRRELEELFHFKEAPVDSFVGSSDNSSGGNMITEWLSLSKSLIECTPSSVIELLRSADDRAVGNAIKLRQIQMEEELRAQADAHEAALKKERDERDAEEKKALMKARLTAYYRTHNPEKVDTIDQILKLFDGRMEVLNEKLKKKYGSGFLPDEAPINQVSNQTKSFFMSVNQSISETKRHVAASVKERRKKSAKDETNLKSHVSVALEVSATEVIPHICSKKQAAGERNTRLPNADGTLNFYLIDCRPESISSLQGRFPKAINMSPETLQDPEELQRLIDMFEALRGAVHICVMGEGFTSFPVLYNHTLSKDEQQLLEDDVSRTSSCALFFLKKGFPFVSILRGGFAAAHAFLSRSGPPGMSPTDVLIDYDPDVSLFALLEDARQEQENLKSAPAREKATRAVQRIIDNSMTRLTLVEQKINSSAAALSSPENAAKVKQSVTGLTKQMPSVSFGRTPPLFMSKKLEVVGENQKSAASDAEKRDKATNNIRLPSFKSDVSSQRESSSEANIDSSSAAPVATREGEIQGHADPSKDSSKENEVRESKLPKIQLDQAKNSLSSFASRLKAADSKGKSTDVGEGTVASTKEEAPSKISASFASFTSRMKSSAATGGSADSNSEEKSPTEEKPADESDTTVTSTKEEAPSKISASFSSFASRMKTSAAATGSKAVDTTSEKETSSNISNSFSSFAAKMKSSATNVTGKAENNDESSISNRLSAFSLKKTTTPDWMKKSDQNTPEGTEERAVSERLGWLMRNEPPGKSFSKSKSEQKQDTDSSEATGDESLVLDVEEEINFDG